VSRFTPNQSCLIALTISRIPSAVATTPPWFSIARKTPRFAAWSSVDSMHSIAHFRACDSSTPLGVEPAKMRIAGEPSSAETSIHALTEAICLSRASPGGTVKLFPMGVPVMGGPQMEMAGPESAVPEMAVRLTHSA